MKRIYKGIVFVIFISLLTLYLVFKDDFETKIAYLFTYNKGWLIVGIVCIFLYYFLKSLVIYFCTKKFKKNYKLKEAFYLMLSVQFFNNVTPFSAGGQPYAIYRLKKQGLTLNQGTNVVVQDFIVYQIALIFLSSVAIIFNLVFNIFPENNFLSKLVFLGFSINFIVIIALFIVAFNKRGNKKILNIVYNIISKFKFMRKKENLKVKFDNFVENFYLNACELMKSKFHFFKIIFINVIALIILYFIPFTLILGLNEYLNPLIVIICSSYVMLIASFVPLPGGIGGLEFSFLVFYGNFVSPEKLVSIMIVWRIITYYLGIFIGFLSVSKEGYDENRYIHGNV